MSRLDNCLTAIVGDKLPIETARKTFFFLLGIAVMLIVIALPSPSPFYKGEEAIPLTANAKIVMAVLCFAVIQWMTEAIPFPATSLCLIVFLHILGVASFDKLVTLGFGNNGSYGCFLCPVDGGGRPRRHDHGPPRLVLSHEAVPAGIP